MGRGKAETMRFDRLRATQVALSRARFEYLLSRSTSIQFGIRSECRPRSNKSPICLWEFKTQWMGHRSPPYMLSPDASAQHFASFYDTRTCGSLNIDVLDDLGITAGYSVAVLAGSG